MGEQFGGMWDHMCTYVCMNCIIYVYLYVHVHMCVSALVCVCPVVLT